MNRLELIVYGLVRDNPVLKQRIVDLYQAILGLVPQKSISTEMPVRERRGYFYGFHDKTPFSADGELLLAHRNVIGDRLVRPGDAAEVGFFHGSEWREFQPIGRTEAWNWQLGSMLQWLGAEGRLIAYNDVTGGRVHGVVCDTAGKKQSDLPHPVVHVTSDGTLACSYDFVRAEHAMPGYGVAVERPALDREGHFKIFECATGKMRYQLSLTEAASIAPHPSMEGAFHFFHHALFNPGRQRAFFLHRWVDRNRRRWTRMFSVGVGGEDLYLFPMDEMVSHITWASDSEVFAYARYPGKGDGYFLIEDRTGRARQLFQDCLNSDGHPTMDKARSIVITDSYPNRFRNQFLLLGFPESGAMVRLCRTHLPRSLRRELQVDLHPRLHPSRGIACFDSGHSGTRSLMTLDFSAALR